MGDRKTAEPAVIEWLLHDDQVIRECFRHAAAILKSVTGASITAVTLLDKEHKHYRDEVGMWMSPVPRQQSLCDRAVQYDDLFVIEDTLTDPDLGECSLVSGPPLRGSTPPSRSRCRVAKWSVLCVQWIRRRVASATISAKYSITFEL
ncbi:hypothetical protein ACU4HD_08200 [Cupriavidus basilensis]